MYGNQQEGEGSRLHDAVLSSLSAALMFRLACEQLLEEEKYLPDNSRVRFLEAFDSFEVAFCYTTTAQTRRPPASSREQHIRHPDSRILQVKHQNRIT
ncbi:hypothetical protein EYF80_021555 [Liparis tanakae]|uniref:Uncharacterized protein n=1 Tax=Liparis tanakae TaxID=230148 RepID=A0A4Z2HTE6_9TELE|nr:hypothetical protein EYF80_021555 [Liparis tanakae]